MSANRDNIASPVKKDGSVVSDTDFSGFTIPNGTSHSLFTFTNSTDYSLVYLAYVYNEV